MRVTRALLIGLVLLVATQAHAVWYARPVNGGAILVNGPTSPRDRLTTFGAPVPLHIREGWVAGIYDRDDIEIVGTGHNCPVRLKGVDYLRREVLEEVDTKTTDLIMEGYSVEVGGTTYTFSMASYAQVNLCMIGIRYNAGIDVFPEDQAKCPRIRLLNPIEKQPGVYRYYVTLTTPAQLKTLMDAKDLHVQTQEQAGWDLKEQALEATDKATLEAIRAANEARSLS